MKSYEQENMEKTTVTINPKISVTVKKIKCNNINVNLNGFSGNTLDASTTSGLRGLATEAQAEDENANGVYGNGTVEKETTIDHQVMTAILGLYV